MAIFSTIKTSDILIDPLDFKDILAINTNMTPLVPFDINSSIFSALINMPSSAFKFSLKGTILIIKY